jgi:acyl-coenzyme A thioesterase PaaI-like protein
MVDFAMGRAVNSTTRAEERPVTIEMKADYLEAGKPEELVARADVLRRGRLFTVVHAEEQVEDGETLAEAMGTFTTIG